MSYVRLPITIAPVASMPAIPNDELKKAAAEVRERLKAAVQVLEDSNADARKGPRLR